MTASNPPGGAAAGALPPAAAVAAAAAAARAVSFWLLLVLRRKLMRCRTFGFSGDAAAGGGADMRVNDVERPERSGGRPLAGTARNERGASASGNDSREAPRA